MADGWRLRLGTGFESTYLPLHDIDCVETTRHSQRWPHDLQRLVDDGVGFVRYPLRWHRIEAEPGHFDWSLPDAVLGALRDAGVEVVVDLVHHTSYPAWLRRGFADAAFAPAFLRYAEAAARHYSDTTAYTLFNEPFATLFLCGHEALWPPYGRGLASFARLVANALPAVATASHLWRDLVPGGRHVWVDTCEHHSGVGGPHAAYATLSNDRRFALLDLFLGRHVDQSRPFLGQLLRAGGEPLATMAPGRLDVVGVDYYPHSEWWYDDAGSHAPSLRPRGLGALLREYAQRYDVPMLVSETNIRGVPSDRASWLRYTLEQCEQAAAAGVPVEGLCWFPYVDSCDWDSLLARAAGRTDPVGVVPSSGRRETAMTRSWRLAASGAPAAVLPAYTFQEPVASQLAGYLPQLASWPWVDPPEEEHVPPLRVPHPPAPARTATLTPAHGGGAATAEGADLVVLSHLRWTWVWQRPQHLISRFAAIRAAQGRRTWFVEEPLGAAVDAPVLRTEDVGDVTRVWLEVPGDPEVHLGFDVASARSYGRHLTDLLAARGPVDVWLYTPMALDLAYRLERRVLAYDVMDDLAAFANAPRGLVLRQRRALAEADLVTTGGRSLHRGVLAHRADAHLFPSGVDGAHFSRSRTLRRPRRRHVAGYVGVIDERVDLPLLAELAAHLADWEVEVVGPIAKIERGSLPTAANIHYLGQQPYERLPEVMAGFDVALMPFARNEATRSISPTKTLEYLAAGLPVVSTRVPDVVSDYQGLVHFADDAAQFAAACREVVTHDRGARDRRAGAARARHEWDAIAAAMAALLDAAAARASATEVTA